MKTFGYFRATLPGIANSFGNDDLIKEFEGDDVEQDGEFVKIWRTKEQGGREQVGAIRLGPGQWVQEVTK